MTEYTYFKAPSGTNYRIHLEQDIDAESPRENDCNIATLITVGRDYHSPDADVLDPFPGEYSVDLTFDVRRASRYAALFMPEMLTVVGLNQSYRDGTLSITDADNENADGVAFVTRESWTEAMGDADTMGEPFLLDAFGNPDPEGKAGLRTPSVQEAIAAEVKDYNNWATGEYVGFVVEQARPFVKTYVGGPSSLGIDWVETDSVWGFDDPEYALDEAKACLPEGSVESDAPETD